MDTKPEQELEINKGKWDGRLIMLSRLILLFTSILIIVGIGGYLIGIFNDFDDVDISIVILIAMAALANSIVGLLIISRYPRHTVGWLLLALGLTIAFVALSNLTLGLEQLSLINTANPAFAIIQWISGWNWLVMVLILIVFIPLYFPDGRLLSQRWRFAALAGVVAIIAAVVSVTISPEIADGDANITGQTSPAIALAGFLSSYVVPPLSGLAFISAIISQILRYRRSGQRQRTQMKWVFYTIVIGVLVIISFDAVPDQLPALQTFIEKYNFQIFLLFPIALPVTIGIAILRYHLYDIDLIIRRTLVYGLLSIALGFIYLGSVILLQQLFTILTGRQSPLAVVVSTLLIAAFFNPLRQQIQKIIDRRFYRQKYDAQQVLERFAETARDETDMEALTAEMLRFIQETMQPDGVTLWLQEGAHE